MYQLMVSYMFHDNLHIYGGDTTVKMTPLGVVEILAVWPNGPPHI